MVTVLLAPGGHKKVMQAFDYFRAIMKERTRFQILMTTLVQEPVDPAFQVSLSSCLSSLSNFSLNVHPGSSIVFYQYCCANSTWA